MQTKRQAIFDEELVKGQAPEQTEIDIGSDAGGMITLYGSGPLSIDPRAEEL